MGTILTSYGDAGYEHEGYAAQVLDDGTLTGTSSPETRPRMVGQVVAACDCGWTGTTRYPSSQEGDEAALAEWEHTHARPVLVAAQHTDLTRLQSWLRGLAARGTDTGRSPRELAEHLANLASDLESAAALAWRLHHQVDEQADQAGP